MEKIINRTIRELRLAQDLNKIEPQLANYIAESTICLFLSSINQQEISKEFKKTRTWYA